MLVQIKVGSSVRSLIREWPLIRLNVALMCMCVCVYESDKVKQSVCV